MKKIFICFFILLSTAFFAQDKSNLVFKESIYIVEIKTENGKNFLDLDKENKIQIVTKNIDPVNLSCIGQNLKRNKLSNDKNATNWTIKPSKEGLKEGVYSLMITFRGKKGKLFHHEFLIPVK
ncbi:hypothetical protein G6N05_09880 [Flavobacterium sp. F372]|uniref:DUF4625 domain-containing protein n=1 Tax=Flavobacterium bernardetii TaxID=2813823 RepID=A0ABR7IYQ1_9FLAO|nr:hypothetical protein [Flavobacterium bernardetii]MBC5834769.1 hypothetical protein [Flavobacterium bernardetii]NHF70417.1 hypothetical protein [Flavobacterium bernardetii]